MDMTPEERLNYLPSIVIASIFAVVISIISIVSTIRLSSLEKNGIPVQGKILTKTESDKKFNYNFIFPPMEEGTDSIILYMSSETNFGGVQVNFLFDPIYETLHDPQDQIFTFSYWILIFINIIAVIVAIYFWLFPRYVVDNDIRADN